eukprot:3375066-Pleurochrysis_carterae.AAC.1
MQFLRIVVVLPDAVPSNRRHLTACFKDDKLYQCTLSCGACAACFPRHAKVCCPRKSRKSLKSAVLGFDAL